MARGRHVKRTAGGVIVVVAIAFGILALALGGVAFAAFRYDRASADRILPGVTVAGVQVGGMTRDQAVAAVDAKVAERLNAPIAIDAVDQTWTETAASLGETADVDAAVDRALRVSDSVGLISRVWHRLRHEPLDVSIDLTYRDGGRDAVAQLVSTIGAAVARAPRDASLDVVDGKVTMVHAQTGAELGTASARRIVRALGRGAFTVQLPVKTLRPSVPDAKVGTTIVVDTTLNKLSLYKGFKLEHTYPVATAMPGYITPPGHWKVIDKVENPTWYNPAPTTWGAGMPASIGPGPGNPLGTRALYLNAPGIRIHGTYETSSIGTHASHGCIRMLIPDVEQLYPLVPIGANVIIF